MKNFLFICTLCSLSPLSPAFESTENTAMTPTTTPQLSPDPQLYQGQLSNGMRYMIRPTAEPKDRMSLRLYVEAGSLDESEETSGLFHFLEHLMFNGSRHFKRGELIPLMQEKGIGFGGDSNAYTGLQQTVYMLDIPLKQEGARDFAFTVLRDFADGATLSDEAIDKERGIIISELKSRDSESYRAGNKWLEQITEGTRIVPFMPIGKEDVILNAPYDAFRTLYRNFYTSDRLTLILTGDFKSEEAQQWVEQYFGDMPATQGAPHTPAGVPDTKASTRIIPNPESALSSISITLVEAYQHEEDSQAKRLKDLPIQLACYMLNRRLDRLSKEENSPIMLASVGQENVLRTSRIFNITCEAQPQNWAPALRLIENEVRRACQYGFQEAELQEAIASMRRELTSALDQWNSISSPATAQQLIASIDKQRIYTAPAENLRIFEEGIQDILKQSDICQQALQKAYQDKEAKLALMGLVPDGLTEEQLRDCYNSAQSQKLSAPKAIEEQNFAYSHIGPEGSIVQQEEISDLGITTLTLSNGIRVNLKALDFEKGKISVNARVDGGLQSLGQEAGVRTLLTIAMKEGGLEKHSKDELTRLFASKKIGFDFKIEDERYSFSGTSNLEDLELQCQVLIAQILHPGFRGEAERFYQQIAPAIYQQLRTSPDGTVVLQGDPILYGPDPRFSIISEEKSLSYNSQDAKALTKEAFQKGAIELSIVGDFKEEDILPILTRSFGAMPERAKEFTPISAEQRQIQLAPEGWGKTHTLNYSSDVDKTLIAHITPLGDGTKPHRNRRLNILASIVREKLFDSLRAQLGEAYSPQASLVRNSKFTDAALLMCLSSGVKGNMEAVSQAMDSVLEEMGMGQISQEDLRRAIQPMQSAVEKQQQTIGYWVQSIGNVQSEPESVDAMREVKEDLESIALEEIQELAKESIGRGERCKFHIVPAQ